MDKSHNTHKEFAQHTCAKHTRKLLGGKSGMMFYDVTSFETWGHIEQGGLVKRWHDG